MTPDPAPHAAGGAVAVDASPLPAARRRPLGPATVARGSVPYLLVAPVVVAIVAILGYPLYKLVALSFQQYGLPELIQRHGEWIGLENYRSVLSDNVFWDTLVRTIVFTAANVGLTIVLGTLIALLLLRLSTPVRILLTSGLVLVWSMPAGRRRPGLVLDDELPERHPQLRSHRGRRSATTSSTIGTARRSRSFRWSPA